MKTNNNDKFNIIILSNTDLKPDSKLPGEYCIYLLFTHLTTLGHNVTILNINHCNIITNINNEEELYYKNVPLDLSKYHGSFRNTCGGGVEALKGIKIQDLLYKKGIYIANPIEAELIAFNKTVMEQLIAKQAPEYSIPSKIYKNQNITYKQILKDLQDFYNISRKNYPGKNLPIAILKNNSGSEGRGISIVFADKIEYYAKHIYQNIQQGKFFVLQEYRKPELFLPKNSNYITRQDIINASDEVSCSLRINIARSDQTYKVMSSKCSIKLGSYLSNRAHKSGRFMDFPLSEAEDYILKNLPNDLMKKIFDIAKKSGINMAGFDVMISKKDEDYKFHILEFNAVFEKSSPASLQGKTAEHCANNFISMMVQNKSIDIGAAGTAANISKQPYVLIARM